LIPEIFTISTPPFDIRNITLGATQMALHRKIDWNAAMRYKRKNRATLAASGLLAEEAATIPFAVAGCYDRSAIMEAVIALARAQKAKGSKVPWTRLVGSALKNIWRRAKCLFENVARGRIGVASSPHGTDVDERPS
jgi:hypothetical protein